MLAWFEAVCWRGLKCGVYIIGMVTSHRSMVTSGGRPTLRQGVVHSSTTHPFVQLAILGKAAVILFVQESIKILSYDCYCYYSRSRQNLQFSEVMETLPGSVEESGVNPASGFSFLTFTLSQ